MKRYSCIFQNSEEDCGAACLAMISKHYKRAFTLSRIREAVGTGHRGTTILGLRRGAEALGFNARSVKANPEIIDKLSKVPLPVVIHWMGYHWVVLYGQKGKKYAIADPAVGVRYLTKTELVEGWMNGVMLILEPDADRFFAEPDDSDKMNYLSRLVGFFRRVLPYRSLLAEALLINIFLGFLSLTSPFFIQILTDDVLVRGDTQVLTGMVIAIIVMNLVQSSLGLVQSNLIAHFSQRLQLGFVLEFVRKVLYLPLSYYEARRSGEIISRLGDVSQINQLVSSLILSFPSQIVIAFVSFCFMISYSGQLTIAVTIIALVMSLSGLIFLPILLQKNRALLVASTENQGLLVETFTGALTLKTTNAIPQAWEELQSRFSRVANLTFSTIQISISIGLFSSFLSTISSIILLWLGSSLVINKELSMGQLLAFNSMSGNFTGLISTIIGFVDELSHIKIVIDRLAEVIDATPENFHDTKKPFVQISGLADITCTNLNFHHAGRVALLKDFSLTIPGGKVTALIGKSGCGKSTLAKVIASLYALQSGNIRIGIYNLQDISLECLREQVVLVPQEPHFLSRSILENFKFSYPQVTFEQIVTACQIANADEFISELPDKYQTVLGEFGANISGGQRQRLAIARAIVVEPPILILDESTGAIDPVGEAEVLDKLLFHRQGKTTIMISHRPRVINRADWIVLLEKGQLKITGTPDELRQLEGNHLNFINP